MRQASLLEFNDPGVSDNVAQDALFENVVEEALEFDPKDTRHQVRPSMRRLVPTQFVLDLRPRWVGRHGQEEIRLAEATHQGHSAQVILVHAPGASCERGRENDRLTYTWHRTF